MRIVLLQPGDEQLLCRAEALIQDGPALSLERAAMLLRQPEFVMVAALDDDGEPIGRIYGHVLHRWETSELLLYEVDTVETRRREGVGKALIEYLKQLAPDRGWRSLWVLTAHGDNPAANRLYQSAGGVLEASPANMYVFWTDGDS
jgi:GNAT superfamily N-acetyltransferase